MSLDVGTRGAVALALSGGAARTIAHLGALDVLQREGITIGSLAGTSGGALVAVMIAAGYPLVDLEKEAREIAWHRIVDFRPHPLGILTTERLGEFVRRRIGDLSFEDLRVPCAVVATDLSTQSRRVFDRGPVVPAIEASCAIPEFYRPVEIDGHSYIDGGVVEPLPIETLTDLNAGDPGVLVAVNVVRRARRPRPVKNMWQLMGQICQLVQYQLVCQVALQADIYVEPDLASFPFFDLENAPGLIAAGAGAMERKLPELLDALARRAQESELP